MNERKPIPALLHSSSLRYPPACGRRSSSTRGRVLAQKGSAASLFLSLSRGFYRLRRFEPPPVKPSMKSVTAAAAEPTTLPAVARIPPPPERRLPPPPWLPPPFEPPEEALPPLDPPFEPPPLEPPPLPPPPL